MKAHICSSKKCNNDCNGTCAKHEDVERERPYYGHHDDPDALRVSIRDLRKIFGERKPR